MLELDACEVAVWNDWPQPWWAVLGTGTYLARVGSPRANESKDTLGRLSFFCSVARFATNPIMDRHSLKDPSMLRRVERNLFFEQSLYLVLFASSAGGV